MPNESQEEQLRKLEQEQERILKEQAGRLNSLTGKQSLETPLIEIPELINYWCRIGDLSLLVGSGGVGKSTVALPAALSLAGGVPFLDFEVPNPEVVLYLDLEMGEYEFRTRLNTLLPNFPKIAAENFHWISIPSPTVTSFKINIVRDKYRLINEIEAIHPRLLIVDNHARFHSGDPNSEKDMVSMVLTPFTQMMVTYEMGLLYLMHTPWSVKDRPRGTMAIFDAATTMISITQGTDIRSRLLKWGKNRSVRRQEGPTHMSVSWDPETYMIETNTDLNLDNVLQNITFPISRNDLIKQLQENLEIGHTAAYKRYRNLKKNEVIREEKNMVYLNIEPVGEL